jgi:hypothetical protein
MNRVGHAASPLLLAAALTAPAADTVYRCPNGSYSAAPCAGGTAIDAADDRSAAQRREAQDAARRDAALADRMAAERRARERQAEPARAASLGPAAAAPKPAASVPKKHAKNKPKRNAAADDPQMSPPMRVIETPAKKP